MRDAKTLWEMKLHENITVDNEYDVKRVCGGWLYTHLHMNTTTFVPLDNEFLNKD